MVTSTATTTGYDINKISGFSENWNSASLLNSSPYKELTAPISLAFVTNKSDSADLYWGNASTSTTPKLDITNPTQVSEYINSSGHSAGQFMLSFGGASNGEGTGYTAGWTLLKKSDSTYAITLADNLATVVSNLGLAGVDIDLDEPYSDATFQANFKIFMDELRLKLGSKKISLDLPNLGACTSKSSLAVCVWANPWAKTSGNSIWFIQGDNAIDKDVDYYNVMNYSWGATSNALQYSQDAVQSYMDLGVSAERLNYGLDVGEDNDRNAITTSSLTKVIEYANSKGLRGIFIWDYNYDQKHAASNNYGNTSLITALTGGNRL
jgi:hypothetical protein